MNELNKLMEPRFTEQPPFQVPLLELLRLKTHQVLRGHSRREHLREQSFCLLPVQFQFLSPLLEQVLQHWEYFSSICSTNLHALVDAFELKMEQKSQFIWESQHTQAELGSLDHRNEPGLVLAWRVVLMGYILGTR